MPRNYAGQKPKKTPKSQKVAKRHGSNRAWRREANWSTRSEATPVEVRRATQKDIERFQRE